MLCWFCNWILVWPLLIGVHRPIQNIKSSFLVKPVMPLIGNLLPHATFILALCISLQQAVITLQNLWWHQRSHCYKCQLVTIKFLIFPHSFSFFSFFLIWFTLFFSKLFQKFSYYTWASVIHNGNSSETLTFFFRMALKMVEWKITTRQETMKEADHCDLTHLQLQLILPHVHLLCTLNQA